MPLVTVITGYYNRAEALELTIDSIMNQTFTDFEFIIFNDCSTDNTELRLNEIKERYNDERIIVKNFSKNMGFVNGLISSISESRGEFICIQGSGDYSYPTRIEEQVNVLRANSNISVVGCHYENYVEDKSIVRLRNASADNVRREELFKENVFSHGEVMFRKSHYELAGGYRAFFTNCQDYDLWLRMINLGSFYTVKKTLYRRYIRYDGVSYNPAKFLKQTRFLIMCRIVNELCSVEQDEFISSVQKIGIEEFVKSDNSLLQKYVLKGILRSVAWQKYSEANELNEMGTSSSVLRFVLKIVIGIYASKYFSVPRRYISNKIGLEYLS